VPENHPAAPGELRLTRRLMSLVSVHTGDWLEGPAAGFADPDHWVGDFPMASKLMVRVMPTQVAAERAFAIEDRS